MSVELFPEGCPVCEKSTSTQHHCQMGGHSYIQCKSCELIYQTGSSDIDTMIACYTGGPIKRLRRQLINGFRRIENQRDFDLRMSRARKIVDFSTKYAKEPGVYLDVGCNKGFNLYAAEEKGWKVYGNELIKEILLPIQNSKPHLKDRIKVGSFVDLAETYSHNFFDLITCIDVIEHLTRPKYAMEQMIRILKPGGVVVYQTCDATPDKMAMHENWKALKPNEHLLLYNQENFKIQALNAGFEKVEFAPEPFEVCDGNFVAICWKSAQQ